MLIDMVNYFFVQLIANSSSYLTFTAYYPMPLHLLWVVHSLIRNHEVACSIHASSTRRKKRLPEGNLFYFKPRAGVSGGGAAHSVPEMPPSRLTLVPVT